MKYNYIRIIVIIILFVGLYPLCGLIASVIQQTEGSVVSILHFIVIYSMFATIFLFGVIPIAYLRHINKIKKEEIKEDIEPKIISIKTYCQECGTEILDKSRKFCSNCGTKIIK